MTDTIKADVLEYIQRQESRYIINPDGILEKANSIKLTLNSNNSSIENFGKLVYYFSYMAAYHFLDGNENKENYFFYSISGTKAGRTLPAKNSEVAPPASETWE